MNVQSVSGDFRGEQAFEILPLRSLAPSELGIFANDLEHVDAFGGCALRCLIERVARQQQCQVTVSPPADPESWRILYHLLGPASAPGHLVLPNDAVRSESECPTSIWLPATPLHSFEVADKVADYLDSRAAGRMRRPARLVTGALAELVENTLVYAAGRVGPPVVPVACIAHDTHDDVLQLVVADLGRKLVTSPSDGRLFAALDGQPDGFVSELGAWAEHLGLDAVVRLAAGAERCEWSEGKWKASEGVGLGCFVASVVVHL